MNNAPKRPPARSTSSRPGRPPRGPRTLPSTNKALRTRLTAAADQLRADGHPVFADSIDEVLAPNGWGKLRRSDPSASTGNDSLGLRMPASIRDAIKERNAAANKRLPKGSETQTITADANEGLRHFVDGRMEPWELARGDAWVEGFPMGEMVNLNLRPDPALKAQADALLGPDHKEEWGWDMRASHVVIGWLMHKYGIKQAVRFPRNKPFSFGYPAGMKATSKKK